MSDERQIVGYSMTTTTEDWTERLGMTQFMLAEAVRGTATERSLRLIEEPQIFRTDVLAVDPEESDEQTRQDAWSWPVKVLDGLATEADLAEVRSGHPGRVLYVAVWAEAAAEPQRGEQERTAT